MDQPQERRPSLDICHSERSHLSFRAQPFVIPSAAICHSERSEESWFRLHHHTAYASTKNFPSCIICCSSTQILNFRPTTSICVDESHSAPVCAPYGFPKAMCTPGYFSSCRISPITSFKSMFVPIANSPTRSLFSSVWVYFQKSFSSSRFSECASLSRFFFTWTVSGCACKLPNFAHR